MSSNKTKEGWVAPKFMSPSRISSLTSKLVSFAQDLDIAIHMHLEHCF